jgi:hypothetical protein
MENRIVKVTKDIFSSARPHKVSKFIPVVRLHQLKRKVQKYHKKIFSRFGKDNQWDKEHDRYLEKMRQVKEDLKGTRGGGLSREILHLVGEAEQYRKIQKQRKQVQGLRQRIMVGLEQDVLFDRFHELFSQVKSIVRTVAIDSELKKCESIFHYTQAFLNGCLDDIEEQKRRAEEELITMRMEHSEDLAYVCRRSPPSDEYEREKKLSALKEVLEKYILPLRDVFLTNEQRVFLEKLVNLYHDTIATLS